jgi:hypothetical protein
VAVPLGEWDGVDVQAFALRAYNSQAIGLERLQTSRAARADATELTYG